MIKINEYDILLESNNIYYINLTKKLVYDYIDMINDYEVAKYVSKNIKKITYEEEIVWIEDKIKNNELIFSMIEKKTGKFIGNVGFNSIKDKTAEIGISIISNMQDKHYGTESLKTIIDYGFKELNLDEINLGVFSNNYRAKQLYDKLGFKVYNINKKITFRDNQYIDGILMNLKKNDYYDYGIKKEKV